MRMGHAPVSSTLISGALLAILFSGQLLRVSEGIDVLDRLVAANSFDARKTQGETAGMARTRLDGIEGDFLNNVRLHFAIAATINQCVLFEMLG